ncbi:hypothetical protein PHISCL_10984 [Aspergillus sclerotialis]|uniref:Uncharacterized protein n=1 Tax=Aspergillus sclerotialis TaxID=2070753 RepID=A0A3A2Z0P1_9EURO|nr:hypothetical protein PHISCL_10984 [Aspergillus sclerotialis]
MDFVQNSGICETTPGVNQYSGYLSVGDNKHMCSGASPNNTVQDVISYMLGSSKHATTPTPLLWLPGSTEAQAAPR